MHSCETLPVAPSTGPNLLLQLGRLIVRSRSVSPARAPSAPHDRLLHAKLLAARPSTSQQVQTQPKSETGEPKPGLEAQLNNHVHALWNDQIPICIEVLLAPECPECYSSLSRVESEASYDRLHTQQRALLLERWTMRPLVNKTHETPAFITSQWLLNAVRSQLHFSQLSAWLARIKDSKTGDDDPSERRRKLSREMCNYKKLEANCDEKDLPDDKRKLNIVYSIKIPGESYKMAEFKRPPTDHTFPITDIGNNVFLKVVLESLPRLDGIPTVKCTCRTSKDHDDLAGKLSDLTLGPKGPKYPSDPINSNIGTTSRRLSIVSNPGSTEYVYTSTPEKKSEVLDDRMHTLCSESGKHRCNCDEEYDTKEQSTSQPKKLDERRLKEIAKYKRRIRKENKKHSSSSEGDGLKASKEKHTSIPILQAARFDRFRAIGCYRNQTYLTLPASRIESKSPFLETVSIPPPEFRKTNTVSTQTDEVLCPCGAPLTTKCENCERGMVRSEGTYNLASLDHSDVDSERCKDENGAKRKHICDNSCNLKCDNIGVSADRTQDPIVKRPKLRRFFPIVDRIEKIVTDRFTHKEAEALNPKKDDAVPARPKEKRQKTFSINDDDYILYEKCDYGTFDKYETESPKQSPEDCPERFQFPESRRPAQDNQVPSPTEVDKFRWRFDSAASMVFHSKTGLPLTSSPAPLKRGNNCFDFDDSINGVSSIKSALFHPISPPSPSAVAAPPCSSPPLPPSPSLSPSPSPSPSAAPSPAGPRCSPSLPAKRDKGPRLRIGTSTGLLGSFEESALKGRLEPVATVHGFTAELGASGAFCPPHKRLPVTVFFYAPGGTNAPYMGHIMLGAGGYRVSRSGTVQVSLFNPHGTLVKMFVVLYDLTGMPPHARTFLRQRTLYMPAHAAARPPPAHRLHQWLRYLIHLRFMTSKSGKLYLHTDIRIIVSRKADLDTATAHTAIFKPISTNHGSDKESHHSTTNQKAGISADGIPSNHSARVSANRTPNRVFGGCGDSDAEYRNDAREIGYDNQDGVSYELRSFTYAPENPKYSPR